MRRLTGVIVCILTGLCVSSCSRKSQSPVETDESAAGLATMVHTADPKTARQLAKGFYEIEQNAWRWTAGRFTVNLRAPRDVRDKGARLEFRFAIPDAAIAELKSMTLRATVNGAELEPQTYARAGEHVFSRDVPARAFTGDAATVEFSLDKFLAAGKVEQRELGVIAVSAGFEVR